MPTKWSKLPKKQAALVVLGIAGPVALGVGIMMYGHAATPFIASEAEAGAVTAPAASITDSTASSGAAVQFKTAAVPSGDWPNASNTGYDAAPDYPGSLKTNCPTTLTSNTTYKFCYYPNGMSIPTTVSNVTFYGCRFTSNAIDFANVDLRGRGVTFDYSSFEPSKVTAPPTAYNQGYQFGIWILGNEVGVTVDHSDFWGWGNGMQIAGSSQANPVVVKNSYFHDARADGGGIDHTDAILSNEGGPSYMVFDHNTIASIGNTQGLALQTETRGYDRVSITNNYFSGFGYTVAIGENLKSTNITFTGNTFGTDFKPVYGPMYSDAVWNTATTGNLWRNNKWRVTPGTTWYTPASDDGKFWLPSGSKSTVDYNQ